MPRVLVVDDDVAVRMLLTFELPGIEVLEADRLKKGLDMAADQRPDAIIIDRKLPDGDGMDLLQELREFDLTADLPIVVVTAGYKDEERVDAIAKGADEYLPKRIDAPRLEACLDRVLGLSPDERRQRRADMVERIRRGEPAEPDLEIGRDRAEPADEADNDRGRFRRRRR